MYIPTLGGGRRLETTLVSLRAQTAPVDVVVIDNGDGGDTGRMLASSFPEVAVVALGVNHGFGPALNRGVAARPAARLLFLNDDVRCDPRFVEALLDAGTAGGSVAGILLRSEDPATIDSAGVVADATLMAFDYLHGRPLAEARTAPAPLGPTGGAALVALDDFNRAGGFDERIFAYLEDVDLAVRLRHAGVGCRLAAGAGAVHEHSATLGSGSPVKNALMGFSRGYLLRRYGVLRRPGRAARALACEGALCAGQLVVDRTVSGVTARVRGWHAGHGIEQLELPDEGLLDVSIREVLHTSLRRRRGVASTATGPDAPRGLA